MWGSWVVNPQREVPVAYCLAIVKYWSKSWPLFRVSTVEEEAFSPTANKHARSCILSALLAVTYRKLGNQWSYCSHLQIAETGWIHAVLFPSIQPLRRLPSYKEFSASYSSSFEKCLTEVHTKFKAIEEILA